MRKRAVVVSLLASASAVLASASGRAGSPSALTLSWSAPSECPSEADVITEVDKRLGGSTFKVPVDAKATVTRLRDGTWQVTLSTDQGGTVGERSLAGPTCAAVASATALILALTIDPEALSRPPTPPPQPPIEPLRAHATVARRVQPSRPRARLYAVVSPVLGLGVLANVPSAGLGLTFGALAGRLSVALTAHAFLPESYDSARPGAGGTFWLLAVGGSSCGAVVDTAGLRFGPCAGLEVEGIHARGYGVSDPHDAVAGFGALTASLFADIHLVSALWLAGRVDGIVPLSRPTFVLEGIGPVFRVQPLSARASVGAEIRF